MKGRCRRRRRREVRRAGTYCQSLQAQLSTGLGCLRLLLPHGGIFGSGTPGVLMFTSSEDSTASEASASDLVASKSEGSLSSQRPSEDWNSSGNWAWAFDVDSKMPASKSSFVTLQIVARLYSSMRAPNACLFFSSSFRMLLVFRTRAFVPVKTFRQCRYTDLLSVQACLLIIVCGRVESESSWLSDISRVGNRTSRSDNGRVNQPY